MLSPNPQRKLMTFVHVSTYKNRMMGLWLCSFLRVCLNWLSCLCYLISAAINFSTLPNRTLWTAAILKTLGSYRRRALLWQNVMMYFHCNPTSRKTPEMQLMLNKDCPLNEFYPWLSPAFSLSINSVSRSGGYLDIFLTYSTFSYTQTLFAVFST